MPTDQLRRRREAEGLSISELAARAGVSRQLVGAVEAGRHTPGVQAALSLARALGCSVEDLFAATEPEPVAALHHPIQEHRGAAVTAHVGDKLVWAPVQPASDDESWPAPDAYIDEGGAVRLLPGSDTRALVVAGCDPALGMAARLIAAQRARRVVAVPASTGAALDALAAGRAHAAVVHGPEAQLPEPPTPVVRWHLARWQVGLACPPSGRKPALSSVASGRTPVAQRTPTASSQQALIRAIAREGLPAQLRGPTAAGHIDAARRVAIAGGVGVTMEPAATAFGLRFIPIEEHCCELWVAEQWNGHPDATALVDTLCSPGFVERLKRLGGYDLTGCGSRVAP